MAVSPAQVELTAEEPMAWSNHTIRLVTGGLAGTHAVSEIVSNTVLRIRGALGMPGNEVSGGEAFVMASEAIAVEKMPGSPLPPLQAGERVYLSGTPATVPDGPYQGRLQNPFGHPDQRAFDGVWTVTQAEENGVFRVGYDSAFLLGGSTG